MIVPIVSGEGTVCMKLPKLILGMSQSSTAILAPLPSAVRINPVVRCRCRIAHGKYNQQLWCETARKWRAASVYGSAAAPACERRKRRSEHVRGRLFGQ